MVSRGMTMVAAAVVVVALLAAVVSGEPGFLKGRPRCHTHVSHVPHYKTVLKKRRGEKGKINEGEKVTHAETSPIVSLYSAGRLWRRCAGVRVCGAAGLHSHGQSPRPALR
ncbi:hypothetical protein E2C01_013366 [Portunus trituberculatus]|uniref:Uncharacterized protein n=1 Tax=Portunus trituberculatus TaxID=210409 RepID=A0A5B7DGY1_PORTR|nr:hypothetical protein [Portunus trituberculatus]